MPITLDLQSVIGILLCVAGIAIVGYQCWKIGNERSED